MFPVRRPLNCLDSNFVCIPAGRLLRRQQCSNPQSLLPSLRNSPSRQLLLQRPQRRRRSCPTMSSNQLVLLLHHQRMCHWE